MQITVHTRPMPARPGITGIPARPAQAITGTVLAVTPTAVVVEVTGDRFGPYRTAVARHRIARLELDEVTR
jgi:hypothetical protein